jgi:hypothetical protein
MILAALILRGHAWFSAPLALAVLALLALSASHEWQALELPKVLTDIALALPPPAQTAEAREAALASFDAGTVLGSD